MPIIKDVMEKLIAGIGPIENTVDTLKIGDADAEVKGIATTFTATHHVIERAIAKGINLIVTHEPTFYNHLDETCSLHNDPIYLAKRQLIESSGMAIFRLHDYIHRYIPDGIIEGLLQDLEWEGYVSRSLSQPDSLRQHLCIPTRTGMELSEYLKRKLDISFVRVVGDLSMPCSRVGLLPGYGGTGALAIPFFQNENLDVIISGEGPEWETPEYVRDAVTQGKHKALIVLGHLKSEEAGMKYLSLSLKSIFPNVPIEFIAEDQVFQVI